MKKLVPIMMLASFSLSACAMQEGDFPSLAKRPFEDVAADTPPSAPPIAVVSSLPEPLQNAVNQAVRQSEAAHKKFLRNLPGVKNRVNAARGSAVSSEAWVVAHMDLAALEIDRSPSVDALATVDKLYAERLEAEVEDANFGGAAIIAGLRQQIEGQVKAQALEIDSLKARLR